MNNVIYYSNTFDYLTVNIVIFHSWTLFVSYLALSVNFYVGGWEVSKREGGEVEWFVTHSQQVWVFWGGPSSLEGILSVTHCITHWDSLFMVFEFKSYFSYHSIKLLFLCEAYEVGFWLCFSPGTITINTPTQILQFRTLIIALISWISRSGYLIQIYNFLRWFSFFNALLLNIINLHLLKKKKMWVSPWVKKYLFSRKKSCSPFAMYKNHSKKVQTNQKSENH